MPTADNESPREVWEQATDAVFHAVHAQLRSKEKRPVLQGSESAVWLAWHMAGEPPLCYRIEAPRWWEPLNEAHASELATRLLTGLREELRRYRERTGSSGG